MIKFLYLNSPRDNLLEFQLILSDDTKTFYDPWKPPSASKSAYYMAIIVCPHFYLPLQLLGLPKITHSLE